LIYRIFNKLDGKIEYIQDHEQKVKDRVEEIKSLFMERESIRFSIVYEQKTADNNTFWRKANLESDPADGTYQVFNTFTGQHELVSGLNNAIARQDEIKKQFFDSCQLDHYDTVDEIPTQSE
jgi:hypothetical protein